MTIAQSPRLLTSDVFDTAVLRIVGRPRSAFLLLGQRLRAAGVWTWDARVFAIQRAQAEAAAQERASGGEPTLAGIYGELAPSPFLTDPGRAMEAELQLERELIVPSQRHASRLDGARAAGTRVSFVSDTYFPSSFLREVLGSLARDDEAIHASCELGLSKRAGTMFARVLELEGEPPDVVLHIGDARSADGTMARRSGITAELCDEPTLNRYEAVLERHAVHTAGATSLLAGSARVARDSQPASQSWTSEHDVAASVAAPLLIAFVGWSLAAARAAGCQHVAYTSRCAALLHAIATRLEAPRAVDDRLLATCIEGDRGASLAAADREGGSSSQAPDPAGSPLLDQLATLGTRSGPWALVGLWWRSHDVVSLNRSLEDAGLTRPLHLLMGLADPDHELTTTGTWQTYLFSSPGVGDEAWRFGEALPSFIDAVCSPKPSSATPDRHDTFGPPRDPHVWATILEVADRLAPFGEVLASTDARPALLEVLALVLDGPDRVEAESASGLLRTGNAVGR